MRASTSTPGGRTAINGQLPVACYCETATRLTDPQAVRNGTCGWSCGRPLCRERAS